MTYNLTFRLKGHPNERGFIYKYTPSTKETEKDIVTKCTKRVSTLYGAPLKCIKIEKVVKDEQ